MLYFSCVFSLVFTDITGAQHRFGIHSNGDKSRNKFCTAKIVWNNSYRQSPQNQTITNTAQFKFSMGSIGSIAAT